MSKGDARRPEDPDKEPGAFERGFDQIEWPNPSMRSRIPWGNEGDPDEAVTFYPNYLNHFRGEMK